MIKISFAINYIKLCKWFKVRLQIITDKQMKNNFRNSRTNIASKNELLFFMTNIIFFI